MTHTLPNLFEFLDTNGDGTGVKNAIGNYSGAKTDFKYVRPEGSEGDLSINSLTIHIQSANKINALGYGGGMGSLVNGIIIFSNDHNGEIIKNFTSDIPIKTNSDWSKYGAKTRTEPYDGGDYFFKVSFKAISPTLPLFLAPEHSIGLTLNDDFTNLVSQTFFIEGTF